jgi:hypothetical protein
MKKPSITALASITTASEKLSLIVLAKDKIKRVETSHPRDLEEYEIDL